MKTNFTHKVILTSLALFLSVNAFSQDGFRYAGAAYNINTFLGKEGTPIDVKNGIGLSLGYLLHGRYKTQEFTMSLITGKHSYLGVFTEPSSPPIIQSHDLSIVTYAIEYKMGGIVVPRKLSIYGGLGVIFNINAFGALYRGMPGEGAFPEFFSTITDREKQNESYTPTASLMFYNVAPIVGIRYFINNDFFINVQNTVQVLPIFEGPVFKDTKSAPRHMSTTIGIAYFLRPYKKNYRY